MINNSILAGAEHQAAAAAAAGSLMSLVARYVTITLYLYNFLYLTYR